MTAHVIALPPLNKHAVDNRAVSAVAQTAGMISSIELLKGQREILIRHGDSVYHLRHTRNDKLILTK